MPYTYDDRANIDPKVKDLAKVAMEHDPEFVRAIDAGEIRRVNEMLLARFDQLVRAQLKLAHYGTMDPDETHGLIGELVKLYRRIQPKMDGLAEAMLAMPHYTDVI